MMVLLWMVPMVASAFFAVYIFIYSRKLSYSRPNPWPYIIVEIVVFVFSGSMMVLHLLGYLD